MGRTGRMFALEHSGIQADVVTVAKGIASGMPLGAFIAGGGLMSWPPGAHGSTFGGNPVSCAAALATLDLLEGGLIENATVQGAILRDGLEALRRQYPDLLGDVRGRGLMLAVECRTPSQSQALVQAAFRRGLLVLPTGAQAVRLSPALTITAEEVRVGLELLEGACAGASSE